MSTLADFVNEQRSKSSGVFAGVRQSVSVGDFGSKMTSSFSSFFSKNDENDDTVLLTDSTSTTGQLPSSRNRKTTGAGWFTFGEEVNVCGLSRFQRYVMFFLMFSMAAFCFTSAMMLLPVLVVATRKFAMLNTLGSFFFLCSFIFLWGPLPYAKFLFSESRRIVAAAYVLSVLTTLYTSIWRWATTTTTSTTTATGTAPTDAPATELSASTASTKIWAVVAVVQPGSVGDRRMLTTALVLIGITINSAYKGIPDSEDKAFVLEKNEYSCVSQKTLPQNFTFVNTWPGRPAFRVYSEDAFNCPNDFLFGLSTDRDEFKLIMWLLHNGHYLYQGHLEQFERRPEYPVFTLPIDRGNYYFAGDSLPEELQATDTGLAIDILKASGQVFTVYKTRKRPIQTIEIRTPRLCSGMVVSMDFDGMCTISVELGTNQVTYYVNGKSIIGGTRPVEIIFTFTYSTTYLYTFQPLGFYPLTDCKFDTTLKLPEMRGIISKRLESFGKTHAHLLEVSRHFPKPVAYCGASSKHLTLSGTFHQRAFLEPLNGSF
uniref:Vesicle transport protein n=1 Tax=Panagrellus redivivus TaxID=6233 RepID=A0A7E4UU06_PANRE